MEEKILYFEKGGVENTETVLDLVKNYAINNGIMKIVLASTRGNTAKAFLNAFEGDEMQLIVIPWQYGFGREEKLFPEQLFPESIVKELQSKGHKVHFGTMLFHTENLYGVKIPQTIANILHIFCQGIKVCVEILMMATDGGCLKMGEKVIAVAGSGVGADTAVIATTAPSLNMKKLKIHKILCKPL